MKNQGFLRTYENLPAYGFSSVKLSQIQTIKELLENSLDAINLVQTDIPSIDINILQSEVSSNLIVISVTDNGCGMIDPRASLECFISDKSELSNNNEVCGDNDIKFIGKFGLGLFCVGLYSMISTDEPIRIVSKHVDGNFATIADFQVKFQQQRVIPLQIKKIDKIEFDHGTRVSVHLQKSETNREEENRSNFQNITQFLHIYLTKLQMLPSLVTIKLTIDVPEFKFNHTYKSNSYIHGLQYLKEHSVDAYEANIRNQLELILSPHQICKNVTSYRMKVLMIKIKIHLLLTTAALLQTNTDDTESSLDLENGSSDDVMNEDDSYANSDKNESTTPEYTSNNDPGGIKVYLWRYANHFPLRDLHDDTLSCVIASATKDVKWKEFGYQLKFYKNEIDLANISNNQGRKLIQSYDPDYSVRKRRKVIDNPLYDDLLSPVWLLSPKDKQLNVNTDLLNYKLVLFVDVLHNSVPFSNMIKTTISQDSGIRRIVSKGIFETIKCLQTRENDSTNLFISIQQKRALDLSEIYIPSLASSLAKIIKLTQKLSEKDKSSNYDSFVRKDNTPDDNCVKNNSFQMIESILSDFLLPKSECDLNTNSEIVKDSDVSINSLGKENYYKNMETTELSIKIGNLIQQHQSIMPLLNKF